ncbi:alkaline phosphatase [Alicyclobacillus cellulosilyticus]|uniref:Alkaline phosphatase n=1 Tax=Alicyclobacillus cellulosilyticus TaxID=1003997 RepID=A0A917K2H9_9BACL|nr:DedA family protein [Alicyclobacillus cellulosilyticus]GGI97585.1 alkaline phosphatase [Alicyclobacillus cellulosilyticus]
MTAHLSTWVAHYGMAAVFILMTLESACIPIPSEAVVPYAGYLAAEHTLSLPAVILVTTAANVFGGLIAYAVGLYGGRPFILRCGRYVLLRPSHLERAEAWFARYGEITVFVCRLLPALRTFISLPAGMAKMRLWRFILYSALGSLPWNFALAVAGYELGRHWSQVDTYVKPLVYVGAAILAAAVVWFWLGRRERSHPGSSDAEN